METIYVQIDDVVREATKEEVAEILEWRLQAEIEAENAQKEELAKKQARIQLLERLGITEDEAKLLLSNAETL